MSKPRKTKLFGGISRDFAGISRGHPKSLREKRVCVHQDQFDHDKGQKYAISGRRLHWRLSTGFFALSPGFMCNLVRRALENLEKVAKNPVEKIASNPVTSVAVMVFSALSSILIPYINQGEKRHININFLLWLTSRWPWDKRVVVPGLTGPKSLCVRLETQEI